MNKKHSCKVEAVTYMNKKSLNYQSFVTEILTVSSLLLNFHYFVITWDFNYFEAIF